MRAAMKAAGNSWSFALFHALWTIPLVMAVASTYRPDVVPLDAR